MAAIALLCFAFVAVNRFCNLPLSLFEATARNSNYQMSSSIEQSLNEKERISEKYVNVKREKKEREREINIHIPNKNLNSITRLGFLLGICIFRLRERKKESAGELGS